MGIDRIRCSLLLCLSVGGACLLIGCAPDSDADSEAVDDGVRSTSNVTPSGTTDETEIHGSPNLQARADQKSSSATDTIGEEDTSVIRDAPVDEASAIQSFGPRPRTSDEWNELLASSRSTVGVRSIQSVDNNLIHIREISTAYGTYFVLLVDYGNDEAIERVAVRMELPAPAQNTSSDESYLRYVEQLNRQRLESAMTRFYEIAVILARAMIDVDDSELNAPDWIRMNLGDVVANPSRYYVPDERLSRKTVRHGGVTVGFIVSAVDQRDVLTVTYTVASER